MSFQKKNNKSLSVFKMLEELKHIAIIMDGNGRWAQNKGHPRTFGHLRGVQTLKHIVQTCVTGKLPYLTVFVFSTENWKRSPLEISVIMKLIKKSLIKYKKLMEKNNIRLHILGDIKKLDPSIQDICTHLVDTTKSHTGLQLIMAINYGGRREIVQALQMAAKHIQSGSLEINNLDEAQVAKFLPSAVFPPPDLIIRTGGVSRLSNFYLWQSAYSEFYVSPVLWPDFNTEELTKALEFYAHTQRRFGAVKEATHHTQKRKI